ncbi:MAG: DUF6787 family protein [Bacteroidota bacterium]
MEAIKRNWLYNLKAKWQLNSYFQVVLVLITFSLAGSSVVFIRPYIFDYIGLGTETGWVIKTGIYIILILPLYQLFLITYAVLLGQHKFFLARYKFLLLKSKNKISK